MVQRFLNFALQREPRNGHPTFRLPKTPLPHAHPCRKRRDAAMLGGLLKGVGEFNEGAFLPCAGNERNANRQPGHIASGYRDVRNTIIGDAFRAFMLVKLLQRWGFE